MGMRAGPMRIQFFVTELGRGGAETQLKRVAEVLSRRGHHVAVLSLMTPVGYVPELRAEGVEVETLDLRRGRPTARALVEARRAVARFAPDVICSFLFHATLLGAAVAGRRPVVSSIRDPSFGGRSRLLLCSGLARAGLIRRVVANNHTVTRQLVDGGHFAAETAQCIPNGLEVPARGDDPAARERTRASLGVGEGEFLWLHVGNFQAPKDHPNLLGAFERVVGEAPDARLRMVGLGTPPDDVARILARDALGGGRAAHLGERSDVPALMEAADALVLSSSSEGLPNVIMEALSHGTPVVSTDVGGVRELVDHGASGYLVPPRDDKALAHGMLELMARSAVERERMGERGRQRILETYDLERVVDIWEALFRSLARPR